MYILSMIMIMIIGGKIKMADPLNLITNPAPGQIIPYKHNNIACVNESLVGRALYYALVTTSFPNE